MMLCVSGLTKNRAILQAEYNSMTRSSLTTLQEIFKTKKL